MPAPTEPTAPTEGDDGIMAPSPIERAIERITGEPAFMREGRSEFYFTDSSGRWVDVVVSDDRGDGFFLQESVGDPLALIELARLLEREGIPVTGVGANHHEVPQEVMTELKQAWESTHPAASE